MKRLLKSFIMLCSISLVLSLTACGNPNTETGKKPASTQTTDDASDQAADTTSSSDQSNTQGGPGNEGGAGNEGGNGSSIQISTNPFTLADTGNPFGNVEEGTADVDGHKYALTNYMTVDGYGKRRATRISSNKMIYYEHTSSKDIYVVLTVINDTFELYDVEYKYIKYEDEVLVSDGKVLNQTRLNDNDVQDALFKYGEEYWQGVVYNFCYIYPTELEFIVDSNSNSTLNPSLIILTTDDDEYELHYTGSGKYLYYSYDVNGKGSTDHYYYEYTRQDAETFTNTNCNYITEEVSVTRETQSNDPYNNYNYYYNRNANPKKIFVKGTEERYEGDPKYGIYYWINGYITEKDDGNWDESNISYSKYKGDQDPASMFTDWQSGAFHYLSLTVQIKPDGTFSGAQQGFDFTGTYGEIDPASGEIPLTCTILEQAGVTIKCQALDDGKILKFYETDPYETNPSDPGNTNYLKTEYCYTLIRQ